MGKRTMRTLNLEKGKERIVVSAIPTSFPPVCCCWEKRRHLQPELAFKRKFAGVYSAKAYSFCDFCGFMATLYLTYRDFGGFGGVLRGKC